MGKNLSDDRLWPNKLVTLLALLEVNAEPFWRLSSVLGQLFVRLETGFPPIIQLGSALGELQREVNKLGIRSADVQLSRIKEHIIKSQGQDYVTLASTLRPMIMDLHMRIIDDLEDRFFISVSPENVKFYRQVEPIFGEDVETAFPKASEDISEAGKCLALGCTTASVFHLMRALEVVVQRLGSKLNVSDKNNVDLDWGIIIANMKAPVEAMPKGAFKDSWSEALTLLIHVKQAWRHPTMHPKETYTEDQAKDVFAAVRSFMRHLSTLV